MFLPKAKEMETTNAASAHRRYNSLDQGKLLIVLTFLACLPVLFGGFIWDDHSLIIGNQMVHASDGLYRFWFTKEAPDYWPLTSTMWWLEWRLWGNSPTGYHVVNVLLHAINAVLVWMILARLKVPGAWLAGCVFALHPVNVATAGWITEQKNTLSMLFYGISILLYFRFDEEGRWRWYGLSLTAFLLALLSKTAVVMLPVVLLGCVWWTRGRVRWKDVLRTAPYFLLSLIMGLVTIQFQHAQPTYGHVVANASLAYRVAASGWIPWFYIYKDILPSGLCVIYPRWHIDPSSGWTYLPGILLAGCLAIFWQQRANWGRPWLFAMGCFVVTLVPVLGLVGTAFYADSMVTDHWQYLAIPWVIGLTVAAGVTACNRLGKWRRFVSVSVSAIVLAALGIATWDRCRVYAQDETLWRDNLVKNPDAWMAHNNLGSVLMRKGKVPEAITHFRQAIWIAPHLAGAHYNLGHALIQEGKVTEGISHYEQALQINPDFANVHYDLGTALMGQGRLVEAISHYEMALQINPDFPEAHGNLGFILQEMGRTQQAILQYEKAVRLKPDYIEAHFNLGLALEKTDRAPEAIEQFEQALTLRPDFAPAREALARLQPTQ
jgi:Tfp pilus assembly protein PilF